MRLRVLALALAVLALSAGVAPAWAHAALVSSTPEDGARLAQLPSRVTFTFSEDVAEPAYVVVRDADGTSVTSGEPVVNGATVTQDLDGAGASGDLTMAYRVVSVDGHPVTGEIGFTVTGEGGAGAEPKPGASAGAGAQGGSADDRDESRTDGAPETTAETAPTAAESDTGHWSRHWSHYAIGGALLAVALALVLTSRSRPE